jgi:LacI family transcriptional regulator
MKRATLSDVAAQAGVSAGTVSNVLNRPSYVSDAVRQRVQDAIAALDYVPRDSARQFRSGRSRNLGLVLADMGNPFFVDLALGAEEAAKGAGVGLVVCNSGEDPVREAQNLGLLLQQRVQGIVIAAVSGDSERFALLADKGVPLVFVDRIPAGDHHCTIGADDTAGGRLAGQHLASRGHTRVAFAGDGGQNLQVAARYAGFVRETKRLTGRLPVTIPIGGWAIESGREAGRRLIALDSAERPTAVFCANDLVALGMLQELTLSGVRVPDDVALVGYDDIVWAEDAAIPLTTIRQPRKQAGADAVKLLLDELQSGSGHEHRRDIAVPELVIRRST